MISNLFHQWRVLHYVLYSWTRYVQRAVNRFLFGYNKLGFVRKLWARKGVCGEDAIRKKLDFETTNSKWSPVVLQAGIHMGGLLVFIQFALAFLAFGVVGSEFASTFFRYIHIFGIFALVSSGVINYLLLFRQDQYLKDFSEFEKLPSDVLSKYKKISCLFVIFVVVFFFSTLLWVVKLNE